MRTNEYGQPVGEPVPGWARVAIPDATRLEGAYCTLERLDVDRHADDLHAAYAAAPDDRDWASGAAETNDPRHYAVIDKTRGRVLRTLALMRQDPANGVIEVGFVIFSRALQRTVASSEAQYLLMRYVFDDLGYRRYEWKCDSLNGPSRRAAERLGFTYEGTFRQNVVYKGRNRDTAWFSLTDAEWPHVRAAFEKWLAPGNFDGDGSQRSALRTN